MCRDSAHGEDVAPGEDDDFPDNEPPVDIGDIGDIDDSEDAPNEEESWDEEKQMVLKSKWALDGCKSLDDVIERSYELIEYYKELKKEGWELEGPIEDDWGFLKRQ
jgi:hypothetical protein